MTFIRPETQHSGPLPEIDQLAQVPMGALALAGVAVGLLLACWLLMYFFVFVTRGPVG